MADPKETADPADDEARSSQDAADEARSAADDASDDVDTLRGRITDLNKRLTKEGRSKAQISSATESLKKELADARAEQAEANKKLDQWNRWYFGANGPANAAEKERFQRDQSVNAQAKAGEATQKNEAATWKAIAEEEDPRIKKILIRSAKDGEFLSQKAIATLRASLSEDDDEKSDEDKKPPKVSGTRTTGSQEQSLDQKLEEAKKRKDKSEILALLSQKAAIQQRVARGN